MRSGYAAAQTAKVASAAGVKSAVIVMCAMPVAIAPTSCSHDAAKHVACPLAVSPQLQPTPAAGDAASASASSAPGRRRDIEARRRRLEARSGLCHVTAPAQQAQSRPALQARAAAAAMFARLRALSRRQRALLAAAAGAAAAGAYFALSWHLETWREQERLVAARVLEQQREEEARDRTEEKKCGAAAAASRGCAG